MATTALFVVCLYVAPVDAFLTVGRAPSLRGMTTRSGGPRMLVDPEFAAGAMATASSLDQIGTALSFSDQGGNLAGTFFQFSLPSYIAFLYFIGFDKNQTPKVQSSHRLVSTSSLSAQRRPALRPARRSSARPAAAASFFNDELALRSSAAATSSEGV